MKRIVIFGLGLILLLVISVLVYYNISLSPTGTKEEVVSFEVKNGMTSKSIISELHKDGLIKNEVVAYFYVKINNVANMQAGTYNLNKGMGLKEIINTIVNGETVDDSLSLTFIEGKRVKKFAQIISEKYDYTEDEILKKWSDKTYLETLISKYWFLTDEILNEGIYYPLEGYLYPDTYRFKKEATIEEITEKLLDTMADKLASYRNKIDNNQYVNTIHKALTLASIVELEGARSDDRAGIAGVFYNRLRDGWNLGSDVTTYYALQADMKEDLSAAQFATINPYNTRGANMIGKMPIGPICNPSTSSIEASVNPDQNDYLFFVADKHGNIFFTKTNAEHDKKVAEIKAKGDWIF